VLAYIVQKHQTFGRSFARVECLLVDEVRTKLDVLLFLELLLDWCESEFFFELAVRTAEVGDQHELPHLGVEKCVDGFH